MKRLVSILILLALLVPVGITRAQSGSDLKTCSAAELYLVLEIVEPYNESMLTLSDRILVAETPDDISMLIEDVNVLQIRWWTEDSLSLPACKESLLIEKLVGRWYDEILISLLLVETKRYNETEQHIAALTAIGKGYTDLIE